MARCALSHLLQHFTQNETDASFKSHTINLPSQTVQQDKDGMAVNFQNLSLQVRLVLENMGCQGRLPCLNT